MVLHMAKRKPSKSRELARLYTMDEDSLRHIEEQHADTGISRSEIVRESVKAYDVRSPGELRAKAESMHAIAEKKAAVGS